MILDSSAIVAIFRGEPEALELALRIEMTSSVAISTATLVETAMVLGPSRGGDLDAFLEEAGVEVIPVDRQQAEVARAAAARFARGTGSRAKLNVGDCFSYALAITSERPLLCTGGDFVHTDVVLALR